MTMPNPLPKTLPYGTIFRIKWPTGKRGLRETWGDAKLVTIGGKPVYEVYPHRHDCQRFYASDVVWDPGELAEAKRKLAIAKEVF